MRAITAASAVCILVVWGTCSTTLAQSRYGQGSGTSTAIPPRPRAAAPHRARAARSTSGLSRRAGPTRTKTQPTRAVLTRSARVIARSRIPIRRTTLGHSLSLRAHGVVRRPQRALRVDSDGGARPAMPREPTPRLRTPPGLHRLRAHEAPIRRVNPSHSPVRHGPTPVVRPRPMRC